MRMLGKVSVETKSLGYMGNFDGGSLPQPNKDRIN